MNPEQMQAAFQSGDLTKARQALDLLIESQDAALYTRFLQGTKLDDEYHLKRGRKSELSSGKTAEKRVLIYVVLALISTAPEKTARHKSIKQAQITQLRIVNDGISELPPGAGLAHRARSYRPLLQQNQRPPG